MRTLPSHVPLSLAVIAALSLTAVSLSCSSSSAPQTGSGGAQTGGAVGTGGASGGGVPQAQGARAVEHRLGRSEWARWRDGFGRGCHIRRCNPRRWRDRVWGRGRCDRLGWRDE
jgi:Spy/CpxP family protein refolding chaperone